MDETPSKSLTGEIHILDIDGFGFMLRVFKRWDDYYIVPRWDSVPDWGE